MDTYAFSEWPFPHINEQEWENFTKYQVTVYNMQKDFIRLNEFKIISVINYIRYTQNHYVDIDTSHLNAPRIMKFVHGYSGLNDFAQHLTIKSFDFEFLSQIFAPYMHSRFAMNYNEMQTRSEKMPQYKNELVNLYEALEEIAKQNDLKIIDKNYMVYSLHNLFHLEYLIPKQDYILYNQTYFFAKSIEELYPDFYKSVVTNLSRYSAKIGEDLTSNKLYYYISILFTQWSDLIKMLYKQTTHLNIYIFSHLNDSHAKMLKEVVDFNIPMHINTLAFSGKEAYQFYSRKKECDIVITSFPIKEDLGKPAIFFDNMPSEQTRLALMNIIDSLS